VADGRSVLPNGQIEAPVVVETPGDSVAAKLAYEKVVKAGFGTREDWKRGGIEKDVEKLLADWTADFQKQIDREREEAAS
jgi:hypothetical protein